MGMETIFEGLNEEQTQAVKATEGFVRVAAGAGSGKTKVLTLRYVYIARMLGVLPEHILSVTFTNKAAWEMRKRIRSFMPDDEGGWILTFHSACHKILKKDISHLAYPSNFMVLDEEDQKSILQTIFDENGLTLRDFSFKKCMDAIEVYKSHADYVPFLTDPHRTLEAPDLPRAREPKSMDSVILQYLVRQRKNFYLDFNDLIQFVLYLFKTNAVIRKKWQEHFEYIQIDEFQDVSGEQYKLAAILSQKHGNLFIVGDPDQTIYSWRGADVKYFLEFDKKFPDVKSIVLDRNYRSTPEILQASNSLIAHNIQRLPKSLRPVRAGGTKPCYFHARSRKEESEWIAETICGLQQSGILLSDIAVLYRGNYMSRPVEEALMRRKLPYIVYGATAFYRRKEIKDALAYLRLLVFADDLSFLRVVNTPPRGIGKTRLERLRDHAAEKGASLLDSLRELAGEPLFASSKAAEFLQAIDEGRQFGTENDIADTLDHILQTSGYTPYLMLSGNQDRHDNLNELKSSVREYVDSAGEETDAETYLNGIALLSAADETDAAESVKLMTVHTAKGLEFPCVFVCCLNEGMFPSRKIRTKEDMEEERRVAYVALTRAENQLYLSDAEGFDAQARGELYSSRFLFNIDSGLLDVQGYRSKEFEQKSRLYIRETESAMGCLTVGEERIQTFAVGDRVRHPLLGAGTVLAAENGAYTVEFAGGKTRSIAMRSDILIPYYPPHEGKSKLQ